MGIDYTAITCFGSNSFKEFMKLPQGIRDYMAEMGEIMGDDIKDFGVDKNLSGLLQGFDCWFDGYSHGRAEEGGENGFLGFGIDIDVEKTTTEQNNDKKRVEKIFKKFNITKPKMYKFVYQW